MQALASTLKHKDQIKSLLQTLSSNNNATKEEDGHIRGHGYHEPTIEERVQRARRRHFITGEEEIFAVCNADLFAACYHGDITGVTMQLAHEKTPLRYLRKRGDSLLHVAVRGRRAHIIKFLLDNQAENELDIDAPNSLGLTPMHIACTLNYGDIVTLLASYGADLTPKDPAGQTPAHLAAAANHLDALKAIYRGQSEPRTSVILSIKSNMGMTCAHLAAVNNHPDIIRFLASVNVDLGCLDNQGETPALKAGRSGNISLLRCHLIKIVGADMETLNFEGDDALGLAYDNVRYG